MDNLRQTIHFTLTPVDNQRLINLCGHCDEHLRQIERFLGVEINNRGHQFEVIGPAQSALKTNSILTKLYALAADEVPLDTSKVYLSIREAGIDTVPKPIVENMPETITIRTKNEMIKARGINQELYLKNILSHDINFGIGPAGTGKTYLAVACAVNALEKGQVKRIILVRPAVEAGEKLGFLPGDLAEKVDPYLRPLYDALYEMLGFEKAAKLLERNIIEVAPLAFMRGRTLNDAFIILDESQNTTKEQMKMFLTRIGFGSTVVITGDITQVDLHHGIESGLRQAIEVLKDMERISFTFFQASDAVRHPLIQNIVLAYERYENKH